ncbi:MAG: hypothetical protein QNJ13_13965 [Paracoccaceae bacterium]|nr:hypothetical protein [Paracoccaceae bacterium]
MSEYLPKDVREGLEAARKLKLRQKSRMRVKAGGQTFTILRSWTEGFALDSDDASRLRGLVDLFDGARHMSRALIVASVEENGETIYEYKRATAVADSAALDYSREDDAPVALIGPT